MPYGRTLLIKLLLVILLVAVGASNHYISVPLLQRWAGYPLDRRRFLHVLLIIRYLVTGQRKPQKARLVHQWTRKVGAEATLVVGVFICTALLLQGVPARHLSHTGHVSAKEAAPSEQIHIMIPVHIIPEASHEHSIAPSGRHLRLPEGDTTRGRQVFVAMGCHACHAVLGEAFSIGGAKPGPELTVIGTYRSEDYLLESILNPNAVILEGPDYTGLDGRSIMPDYHDLLTVGQLIDLIAYLKSLR